MIRIGSRIKFENRYAFILRECPKLYLLGFKNTYGWSVKFSNFSKYERKIINKNKIISAYWVDKKDVKEISSLDYYKKIAGMV